MRGLSPLVVHVLLKVVIFKTKISKAYLRVNYYLLLKFLLEAMNLAPPNWAKSLAKFNPKMQHFKRVLSLTCKYKGSTKQLELFNWRSNLKNVVLSNGSKNVRNA